MKRFLLLLMAVGLFNFLNATNVVTINESGNSETGISLVSSNTDQSILSFKMNEFSYSEVETSRGSAWSIFVDGSAKRLKKGSPELPLFYTSVIIPSDAEMQVEVLKAQYVEYENVLVAPSKGNFDRTINPSDVEYEFGPQYQRDDFFPLKTADLRSPYIIRDFRGQTVLINPFVYNAVTKTLRVYYNIELKVFKEGISNINTLASNDFPTTIDSRFKNIYQRQFINYESMQSRYTPVEEDGNMLIISYGDFMDEMDPFIDWKIKTGTEVEIVDVATIGGASAIKTYIADYYNDNGLTFVLLVGDAQQLPSSTVGGNDSDVDYSYIVGGDHYPDCFVGRFSAQNADHVITQVQRTIDYERYPLQMSSWYDNAIGIASDQGPGDDNEYDYVHMRNIANNKLIPFTYSYAYELFDGSQGGEDADGNPNPTLVADAINSGATIINYTGHGSDVSWGTSGFSSNNVNNLTNNGKLPFIISVACVNGNFVGTTCFAEAWLRAENDGEPAGAVATLMSTINQSWNPPMRGQDEMNDILTEADENNIKRTFGGITMNGCMGMNDAYGSGGDEMTDTWTIFGDPSLMVRTAIPETMNVTHNASIPMGSTTFQVNCNAEGALAVLSMDGEIIASAYVTSGTATMVFTPLQDMGTMDLVITSFNYLPYESTVDIINNSGPFVVYANNFVNDESGNNDNMIDYNESILLTVGLTNVGADDAIAVNTTISSNSEFISFTDTEEPYGNIASDDTVSVADGFAFDVFPSIPDGSQIGFTVTSVDESGRSLWESTFELTAHSPELNFVTFTVDDSNGNNNGRLDAGENADIIIEMENAGSAEAFNVLGTLNSNDSEITINNSEISYGDLNGGDTYTATYNVTVAEDAEDGITVFFNIDFTADYGINNSTNFSTYVGLIPVLVMDFAPEVTTAEQMQNCFTMLNVGSEDMEGSLPLDLDKYKSIFVILGAYPNNHVLSNEEGQMLSDYLDNGGRVYMEGGDTWAFDDATAVHEKFMIDGTGDGQGDINRIYGYEGSMLQGYSFTFDGVNNYIDRLSPIGDAQPLLQNENPNYITAISYENETYKTIGSSADFGGLVGEDGWSKDALMAEYLYFFGVDFVWTDVAQIEKENINLVTFPNPFSNKVDISLNIKENQNTEISIYSLNGKKIRVLHSGELNNGKHNFTWDASAYPAGIYIYNVKTNSSNYTGKLVLTK